MQDAESHRKMWRSIHSRWHLPWHGKVGVSQHLLGHYCSSLCRVWLLVLSPSTLGMACGQGSIQLPSTVRVGFPDGLPGRHILVSQWMCLFSLCTCSSPDLHSNGLSCRNKSNLFPTRLSTVHKKLINYSCDKSHKKKERKKESSSGDRSNAAVISEDTPDAPFRKEGRALVGWACSLCRFQGLQVASNALFFF